MKRILLSSLFFLATIFLATPASAQSQTGAFNFELDGYALNFTCEKNSTNCEWYTYLHAHNITGENLYNVKIWTHDSEMTYFIDGVEYTGSRSVEWREFFEPDYPTLSTPVYIKPDTTKVGKQYFKLYMNGQTCDQNTTPPDCHDYGTSKLEVVIDIIDTTPPSLIPTIAKTTALPTSSIGIGPTTALVPNAKSTPFNDSQSDSSIEKNEQMGQPNESIEKQAHINKIIWFILLTAIILEGIVLYRLRGSIIRRLKKHTSSKLPPSPQK